MSRQALCRGAVLALGLAALLGACSSAERGSITLSAAGFPNGRLQGTQSITPGGATFAASEGNLSCSGSYFGLDRATSVSTTILCSDSRHGTITMTGEGGRASAGTFKLNDGTQGTVAVQ